MEDYKKTGEDKNYEYYRNDSEVNSDDGDDETYLKILNKRKEFNVKIFKKEIKIKKRTLNKIMILSSSEPEEQVLFSLYKTVPKDSKDKDKFKQKEENQENEIILNEDNKIKEEEINIISNDPLSSLKENNNNNNDIQTQNILIKTNDINLPNNNTEINIDNEELAFGKEKVNLDNVVLVGLPPEAIKVKWFYLLLAIVGLGYMIIFLIGIFNKDVGLNINIFSVFLFGIVIFFTGVFGFVKINKRIYDNIILLFFTIITIFAGIAAAIIVNINEVTERYFMICLIFGIICCIFSLMCIFWTNRLKKNILISKSKKLERLM